MAMVMVRFRVGYQPALYRMKYQQVKHMQSTVMIRHRDRAYSAPSGMGMDMGMGRSNGRVAIDRDRVIWRTIGCTCWA